MSVLKHGSLKLEWGVGVGLGEESEGTDLAALRLLLQEDGEVRVVVKLSRNGKDDGHFNGEISTSTGAGPRTFSAQIMI